MSTDGCVWIATRPGRRARRAAPPGETVTMTLEEPDLKKVVKAPTTGAGPQAARQAAARKRLDTAPEGYETFRRSKVGAAPGPGEGGRQRTRAGLARHQVRRVQRLGPAGLQRADRSSGWIVTKPEEILSYRVTLAPPRERRPRRPGAGHRVSWCEACADLDHEQVGACMLTQTGAAGDRGRDRPKGNDHASVSPDRGPGQDHALTEHHLHPGQ